MTIVLQSSLLAKIECVMLTNILVCKIMMKPLELALIYMDCFYNTGNLEALEKILAPSLVFEGPLFTFDSASAYLTSLRDAPPEGMRFELLQAFENQDQVCLIYQFSKADISVPMAQSFKITNNKISKIRLIFDTRPFVETTDR